MKQAAALLLAIALLAAGCGSSDSGGSTAAEGGAAPDAAATSEAPPTEAPVVTEADRLLDLLASRCEEDRSKIEAMAELTVEKLEEDGGIESSVDEQLREAKRATDGPHPAACSEVFASLLVVQIG